MKLSGKTLRDFAKATAPASETGKQKYYGTVKKQGTNVTVKIDGSDIQTPMTNAVNVLDGDRVIVEIVDHKLVITGNISNPPDAALASVSEVTDTVDDLAGTVYVDEGVQHITEHLKIYRNGAVRGGLERKFDEETVEVQYGQTVSACEISLDANSWWLVLASVRADNVSADVKIGAGFVISDDDSHVAPRFSGISHDNSSVTGWGLVNCKTIGSANTATVSLQLTGYYATTHNETARLVAIPITAN